jgi:hypothetical protein
MHCKLQFFKCSAGIVYLKPFTPTCCQCTDFLLLFATAVLAGCTLTIAPLTHDLPSSSESLLGNLTSPAAAQEPHSISSPISDHAAAAAAAMPYGRSPLGLNPGSNPPIASWRRPPASQLLSALPKHLLQRPLQQQQQQPQQEQEQADEEGQGSPMAISPEADASVNATAARAQQAAQQQQLQDEQQQDEQQQQELVGEASAAAGFAAAEAAPNTPVNLKQATSDNTSCSGTPNTPAEQRNGLLRGAGTSPSDYVTPQHRLRLSRPLAPLHKDCLIAAATRVASLAGNSQDAAAASTPAATGKGTAQHAPSSADDGAGQEGVAEAAAVAAAAVSAAAGSTGQQTGSSDSSKGDDRFMDSPLQPCQQLQSPTSQWHQGMVAMLRNLQQTPLQPHAASTDGAAPAGCDASAAGEGKGKACEGGGAVRAGSRALRRLQDELERGSGIAAASAAAAQQELGASKSDVQMPFSSALMTPPTAATSAAACSAPMLLPLFSPAAAAGGSAQQPAAAGTAGAAAGRGGPVASVSLTPAVMSCSRAEQQAFTLPVSAGMTSLAPAGLPAVAWPVQQRPDGGLVVTAPPGSDVPAAAVLQLTSPPGTSSSSRPGSSGNKENAAAAGALQCSAPLMTGEAMSALLRQHQQGVGSVDGAPVVNGMLNGSMHWPGPHGRVTVVSIQPVTMLASMMGAAAAAAPVAAAAAAAGLAAVQPMLPLPAQSGKPCSSSAAVAEQRKPAAASTPSERFESSHAATVRSRLHALIDGV